MRDFTLGTYLKWLGIIALGIIAINMMACASTPVVAVDFPSPFQLGQVVCDTKDKPVILIANGKPPSEIYFVLIHEQKHVQQIRKSGSCKKQSRRYRLDPDFRLEQEAEAFCADIVARVARQGRDKVDLKRRAAIALTMYSVGKTAEEIEAKLPC